MKESFGRASEEAHEVLGLSLFLVVCVWGSMIILKSNKNETWYRMSGIVTVGAGLYLSVWVYAMQRSDLIQLQHLAMGFSLIAAGCSEIVSTYCLQFQFLHDIWFMNLVTVGAIFLAHPSTGNKSMSHAALGFCLILGAYCAVSEKRLPNESFHAIFAGAFFGLAALVLVAFQEEDHPPLIARTPSIGLYVAYISFLISILSLATHLGLLLFSCSSFSDRTAALTTNNYRTLRVSSQSLRRLLLCFSSSFGGHNISTAQDQDDEEILDDQAAAHTLFLSSPTSSWFSTEKRVRP